MDNYIIDSSVWVSVFNEKDSQHEVAIAMEEIILSSTLVPDFILQETATVLKNKVSLEIAEKFISSISNNDDYSIMSFIEMQDEFNEEFINPKNKNLSYIDSSLLAIQKSGKYKVVTLDKNLQKLFPKK